MGGFSYSGIMYRSCKKHVIAGKRQSEFLEVLITNSWVEQSAFDTLAITFMEKEAYKVIQPT